MANFSPIRTGSQSLDRNLDQLSAQLNPVLSQLSTFGSRPTWTLAQLQNGYTNLGTVASGLAQVSYFIDPNNVVWSKGLVANATGSGIGAGKVIYQLPVGMRPMQFRVFLGNYYNGATDASMAIDVDTSGNVANRDTVANGGWLSLEFSFQAEQ
jgi:hypothetical protein